MAPRFLLQVNTRDTLFLVSDMEKPLEFRFKTLPEAEIPGWGSFP